MWRARNPDNPRSVAAQNEQSTMRFVPFASSANLVPELKEAMQLNLIERGPQYKATFFQSFGLD
jgi:hypothetical protein